MRDSKRLGRNIETLIRRQNKTIREMATTMNCSVKAAKRVITGNQLMTFSQFSKVVSWLDVSIVTLLNDSV